MERQGKAKESKGKQGKCKLQSLKVIGNGGIRWDKYNSIFRQTITMALLCTVSGIQRITGQKS